MHSLLEYTTKAVKREKTQVLQQSILLNQASEKYPTLQNQSFRFHCLEELGANRKSSVSSLITEWRLFDFKFLL